MGEIVLHFTVPVGADKDAIAAAFQNDLAGLPDVKTVKVRADQQRFVGPQEVIVILTTATRVIAAAGTAIGAAAVTAEASAKLLESLRHVIERTKELGKTCGLGGGRLEAGLRQVPLDAVTERDLNEAASG